MLAILAIGGLLLTNPPAKPSPAASPVANSAAAAKRTIYCIESTNPGSRIVQRDCLTRAEWLERNYDPLAPQR